MVTSRGVGQYVASEAHSGVCGRAYQHDATKRPVIYFTGANGDDRALLTSTSAASQIAPALADAGVPLLSAAFGSPPPAWGNDTSQTRIGQAWTLAKTLHGCKTDKFIGIGVSKGFTALANYARNNPSNVAAIIGIVPVCNVSAIFDADRQSLAAEINTAYGAAWAAAAATHDPALNTATHLSQAVPMKLIYGTGDTTVLSSEVTAFASAVGATAQSMGATDHLTTGPAIDPTADVLAFLTPYL